MLNAELFALYSRYFLQTISIYTSSTGHISRTDATFHNSLRKPLKQSGNHTNQRSKSPLFSNSYSSANPPIVSELLALSDLLPILPIPNELSLFFNLDVDLALLAVIGRSPAASSPLTYVPSGDNDVLTA